MAISSLRRFLYYPERLPATAALPPHARDAREVYLDCADGVRIHALYWAPPPGRPVILYFHGNAGHVFDWALVRADLVVTETGLLLVDYHGYGKSGGAPSEAALFADGAAALAWLTDEAGVPLSRIVLLGKSLGGGVAGHLAKGRPLMGLVLESTFTSIPAVARNLFAHILPFVGERPLSALLPDRFDTLSCLPDVRCPVLGIHGERDSLIPVAHGRALYEAAAAPKELWLVPRADHNDVAWVAGEGYGRRIREWLESDQRAGGADEHE